MKKLRFLLLISIFFFGLNPELSAQVDKQKEIYHMVLYTVPVEDLAKGNTPPTTYKEPEFSDVIMKFKYLDWAKASRVEVNYNLSAINGSFLVEKRGVDYVLVDEKNNAVLPLEKNKIASFSYRLGTLLAREVNECTVTIYLKDKSTVSESYGTTVKTGGAKLKSLVQPEVKTMAIDPSLPSRDLYVRSPEVGNISCSECLDNVIDQALDEITASPNGVNVTIWFDIDQATYPGDAGLVQITEYLPTIEHTKGSITFKAANGYNNQGVIDKLPPGYYHGFVIRTLTSVDIDGLTFKDFYSTNFAKDALWIEGFQNLTIQNCFFINNYFSIKGALNAYGDHNAYVEFNLLDNSFNNTNSRSICELWITDQNSTLNVLRNRFTDSEFSIINNLECKNVTIDGCIFSKVNATSATSSVSLLAPNDWTITNNQFSCYSVGIYENSASNGSFTNNYNQIINETQKNTWQLPGGLSIHNGYGGKNRFVIENQTINNGCVIASGGNSGAIVRKTKILGVNYQGKPIFLFQNGNQSIPSPTVTNVSIINNEMTIGYTLGAYTGYARNIVVDFYLSNSSNHLVEYLGSSVEFDDINNMVEGTHHTTMDLSIIAPGVTINPGDKIAATVSSLGDDVNYGDGTSEATYISICGIASSITDIDQYCENNSTAVALSAVPTGGTFSIDNNPIGNSFIPSNYAVGQHTLSYTVGTCTATYTLDITPLPQNTFNITGGEDNCNNVNTQIGLSGSEPNVFYQLYHQVDGGAEKNTIGEAVEGTGAAISFGGQNVPGIYTVATIGCVSQMAEEAKIDKYPALFNITGGGYFCSPATQSVGLDGSEAGYTYQLIFEPKSNPGVPEIKESQTGTGSTLSFTYQATEVGTYYIQAINGSCTRRMTGEVQIISIEVLDIGSQSVCTSSDMVITVPNSEAGVEYSAGYFPGSPEFVAVRSQMGNGSDITITIPAVELVANTEYLVRGTHIAAGCTANTDGSRIVNQTPILDPISPSYCAPASIEIGTKTSGRYQYRLNNGLWTDMPNGTFIPMNTGNNYDNYDFRYTSMFNCTSDVISTRVYIIPDNFTISLDAAANNCSAHSKTIHVDNTQEGINYSLIFTDSNNQSGTVANSAGTGNALSFTHTPTSVGTYTVVATNQPSTCSTPSTNSIEIYLTPGLSDIDPAYCATAPSIPMVGTPAGGTFEYSLNNGVNWAALANGTIVPGNTTGLNDNYVVRYTSVQGCLSSNRSTIIYGLPTAKDISINSSSQTCSDYPVIVDVANSQAGVTYQLIDPLLSIANTRGGTGTTISLTDNPALAGVYSVTAYNHLQGCSSSMSNTLLVKPTPAITNISTDYCSSSADVTLNTSAGSGMFYVFDNTTQAWVNPSAGYIISPSALAGYETTTRIKYEIDGCSHTYDYTIHKQPDPKSISSGGQACSGNLLNLTIENSETGMDYQLFQNGSQAGSPVGGNGNVAVIGGQAYAISGDIFTATVNHHNMPTCTNQVTGNVVVLESPELSFNGNKYCEGEDIELPESTDTYYYNDGAQWTSIPSNILNTGTCGSASCNYLVRSQSAGGCPSNSKEITVYSAPDIKTISSLSGACYGNPLQIVVENSQPGINYQLLLNGNIIPPPENNFYRFFILGNGENISFPVITGHVIGNEYSVLAMINYDQCSTPMANSITVTPAPGQITDAIGGPVTVCQAGTGNYSVPDNYSGYFWQVPANWSITSGQGTNSIQVAFSNHAVSGELSVSERSPSGCIGNPKTIDITVNPLPVVTVPGGELVPCFNGNSSYTTNYNAAYTYEWELSDPLAGNIISGNGTNNITIDWDESYASDAGVSLRVRATNACGTGEWSGALNISPLHAPVKPVISGNPNLCRGIGSILYASSNYATSYVWNASGTATITPDAEGTQCSVFSSNPAQSVEITVISSNKCNSPGVSSDPYVINIYPVPDITITVDETIECPDQLTGSASVVVAAPAFGPALYTYTWTTSTTNAPVVTNLTGNGTLTVRNSTGCSTSQAYVLDNRPQLNVVLGNAPCNGGAPIATSDKNNMRFTVTSRGDNFNFSYSIPAAGISMPGFVSPHTETVGNLTGQTPYQLQVTKEGCTTPLIRNFTLMEPSYSITSSNGGGNVICDQANLDVTINRSTPLSSDNSYDYTITGHIGSQQFTVSAITGNVVHMSGIIAQYGSGNYHLDITDNLWGCTTAYDFAVNPFTVSVSPKDATCKKAGMATVATHGGTPPFNYRWFNANGTQLSGLTGYRQDLNIGTYYVEVEMPGFGCQVRSQNFTIGQEIEPTNLVLTQPDDCSPTATFTPGKQGHRVEWVRKEVIFPGEPFEKEIDVTEFSTLVYSNTAIASNLPNGEYTVNVIDANGCTISDNMVIDNTSDTTFNLCIKWDAEYEDPDPYVEEGNIGTISLDIANSIDAQLQAAITNSQKQAKELYNDNCLKTDEMDDELLVTFDDKYEHYTLYYYDRAGNLVQTLPPAAVTDLTTTDRSKLPGHNFEMATTYQYNSFGQVVKQKSPDGGTSQFVYDKLGRLRFSQNAKQADPTNGVKWSYSIFDKLGRPIEAGEFSGNIPIATLETNALDDYDYMPDALNYPRSQWVKTTYSDAASGVDYFGEPQGYLNNRVSYTQTDENLFTYYSYDPHGNVNWMVQEIPGIGKHTLRYEYDLVSGNVTKVIVNEGRLDCFYHKYNYDGDNRLLAAYTSRDGEIWDQDANYLYYQHGPLRRAELGQDKVQGVDYVYTLQGWLKSINNPVGDDPGNALPDNSNFAQDVFSMSLSYYNNDYVNDNFDLSNAQTYNGEAANNLYNGNIGRWTSKLFDGAQPDKHKAMGMSYTYDQLNRIKSSRLFDDDGSGANFNNPHTTQNLTEYEYDGNGNITSLKRRSAVPGDDLEYDVLQYTYGINKNQLQKVTDISTSAKNGTYEDITGEHSYKYDAIGNLIRETETINGSPQTTTIVWTVQNKVKEVIPQEAANEADQKPYVAYTYDANGNRVHKFVNKKPGYVSGVLDKEDITDPAAVEETYYLRDAQGNVMNVYLRKNAQQGTGFIANWYLLEQHLYGSDRLGLRKANEIMSSSYFNLSDYFKKAMVARGQNLQTLPSYNWATVGFENVVATDINNEIINIPQTNVDVYSLQSNGTYAPVTKLEHYNASNVGNITLAEDQAGELQFYALTARQNNADVCLLFDAENNLLENSGGLLADNQKEMTTIEIPVTGGYYLFTQQGGNIYRHQVVYNQTSSKFEVTNKNQVINSAVMNFTGDIAAIEDRENEAAYLYATVYDATGSKLNLYRYTIDKNGITQEPGLLEITGAQGGADLQIDQAANKLLIEYFTGLQNPVTLTYQSNVAIYGLSGTYLPLTDNVVQAGLLSETPERGSAVFSASGNKIYFKHQGVVESKVRSIGADGKGIQRKTDVSGNLYTAYDGETYLAANGEKDLYHWQEGMQIGNDVQNYALTDKLPQLSIKVGEKERMQLITRTVREKYYELKDHLGNVRATISDLRTMQNSIAQASLESYNNYYPFGMLMSGRWSASEGYRYGFNGKEMDIDMAGGDIVKHTGAIYDYGFRIVDTRIGRFLSVDPLTKDYPWYTPYQYAGNTPIVAIDLDGLEDWWTTSEMAIQFGYWWLGIKKTTSSTIKNSIKAHSPINSHSGISVKNSQEANSYNAVKTYHKLKAAAGGSQLFLEGFEITAEALDNIPGVDIVGDPLLSVYYGYKGDYASSAAYGAATFIPIVSGYALKTFGKVTIRTSGELFEAVVEHSDDIELEVLARRMVSEDGKTLRLDEFALYTAENAGKISNQNTVGPKDVMNYLEDLEEYARKEGFEKLEIRYYRHRPKGSKLKNSDYRIIERNLKND